MTTLIERPTRLLQQEANKLLGQIELDMHQQRAAKSEYYNFPYELLTRLIAVALPQVPDDVSDFLSALGAYVEELEPCAAKSVGSSLTGRERPTMEATTSNSLSCRHTQSSTCGRHRRKRLTTSPGSPSLDAKPPPR